MFARRLTITIRGEACNKLVPKTWLDDFFMRNFTGYSAFDETLVIDDGLLEASLQVPPEQVRQRLEAWLLGRKLLSSNEHLSVTSNLTPDT